MKNLAIIFSVLICGISLSQEEMFANEGSGTFQNNPASFGNQQLWSVNSFGQIGFTEYYGNPSSLNFNAGGIIRLTQNRKHHLILGGMHSSNSKYLTKDVTSRVSLGYRFKWNENSSMSLAVGPGISDLQYKLYHISASSNGAEIYYTEENHGRQFDMSIGAMYNWKTLYAGMSVTHLNRPLVGDYPVELAPTYSFQTGYKIPIHGHSILPVAQFQYVDNFSRFQFMANYIFKKNLFSVGAGYRSGGSLLLGASVELKGIQLGYNYNTMGTRGAMNTNGTHELRLSFVVRQGKSEE